MIEAITPDFMLEPIRALKEDMLNAMLEESIGMTKDQLEGYLTSPNQYFDQVMTTDAGESVTLAQFNAKYLHINDPAYTDPNESFDYRMVPAAYNTVTMSKLILLGPSEVNRLLRDLNGTTRLDDPTSCWVSSRRLTATTDRPTGWFSPRTAACTPRSSCTNQVNAAFQTVRRLPAVSSAS